jgi:hypothetical protein
MVPKNLDPMLELTIVNRVTAQIWTRDEEIKLNWLDDITAGQQRDAAKVTQQQQQQQQQQHGQLNRGYTQNRPMRPPGSPMNPNFHDPHQRPFNNGPMSPPFPGYHGGPMNPPRPMQAMGGPMGGPMGGGPMSPGFRPMMNAGGRPSRPPADHRMVRNFFLFRCAWIRSYDEEYKSESEKKPNIFVSVFCLACPFRVCDASTPIPT